MTPETEVITCPACKYLVRVPLDWLGTQVQCPECRALFRAPVRIDGALTEPELISRPAPVAPRPTRPDPMLLLPAFGLLLCGVTGAIVNGATLYFLLSAPDGGKEWALKQAQAFRQIRGGPGDTPEQQAAADEEGAMQLIRLYRWVLPLALAVSLVVFTGGLSITLRRNYRLAKVACVLATVNIAYGCCIPGALAGLWGLLMLNSDEGREHFRR